MKIKYIHVIMAGFLAIGFFTCGLPIMKTVNCKNAICKNTVQMNIQMDYDFFQHFSWSPHGEKIAFASRRCGHLNLYMVNADGTSLERLTKGPFAISPVWSPDGEKIAFTSVSSSGHYSIFVINKNAKNKKQLISDDYDNFMFKWSLNGEKIFFLRGKNEMYQLYTMDIDGSNKKLLINFSALGKCYTPSFSPDEQKIAFSSDKEGNQDIYIINVDGSNLKQLTNGFELNISPQWSPDGEKIAFETHYGATRDIYVIDTDGRNLRKITTSPPQQTECTWSPDGEKIAFTSLSYGNYEIYVINADGSPKINLTNHSAKDTNPVWSPDGEKIAFFSDRESKRDIYVMNADGSHQINITEGLTSKVCQHPLVKYWYVLVGVVCGLTYYVYRRFPHFFTDKRVTSSVAAGGVFGAVIFILIQKYPIDAEIFFIPFEYIIYIVGMAAGVFGIILGRNVIKTSKDLLVLAFTIGIIFSSISVCGMIYKNISQGIFLGDSYILYIVLGFVMFFIISFLASLGAGSLFIQHALRRPIDEDDSN